MVGAVSGAGGSSGGEKLAGAPDLLAPQYCGRA
jgi:hypothetical protein